MSLVINQAPTTVWRDSIFPNSNCHDIFNTNQRHNTSTSSNSRGMQVQSSRRSQSSKPRYPQYASKSYRLDSYSNWPRNLQQRPEDLAAAGFFHIGIGDVVKCFTCGGGLKEWDPEDDPLTEHAKWFPACAYIKSIVGGTYVTDHSSSTTSSSLDEELSFLSCNSKSNQQPNNRDRGQAFVSKSESKPNVMIPAYVVTLMEMGYSEDVINTAIILCKQHGKPATNASSILQVILDQEEVYGDNADFRPNRQTNIHYEMQHKNELMENKKSEMPQKSNQLINKEVARLTQENKELRGKSLCKICKTEKSCVVFTSCGHLVTCAKCSSVSSVCPVCNTKIQGSLMAYLS